jgi:hypothetical protein
VSVNVMVVIRVAFVIEIGTVNGPEPTLKVVDGGDRMIWATPIPAVVIGSLAAGGIV